MNPRILRLLKKYRFDGSFEELGQSKCEWKAGVEFAGFDGIDALPGDLEFLREVCLAPISFCPQDAKPVIHWFLHSLTSSLAETASTKMSGLILPIGIRDPSGWK